MPQKPEMVNNVVATLKAEILEGKYGASGAGIIPPRTQLAKRFGVSSETINRAILHLQAQGLIIPAGRNVVVDTPNLKLPGVTPSFDKYLIEQGLTPEFQNVGAPEVVKLEAPLAERFRLEAGTEAIRRLRLQGARRQGNGDRLMWYRLAETYYLRSLVTDEWLQQITENPRFVLINAIKESTGKFITHAHSEIVTRFPTEEEQKLLGVTFQTPINEHFRMCYADDETLIMFNRILLVSHRFTFEFDYPISL